MLKRLTAALLSLTIMVSAFAPAVYALDETQPQQLQIEEQQEMPETAEDDIIEDDVVEDDDADIQAESETTEQQLKEEEAEVQQDNIPQQSVEEVTYVTENVVVDTDLPENDEIFGAYVEQQFYGSEMAVFGTAGRDRLSETEKAIYDLLKARIEEVAENGGTTAETFAVSDIFENNPTFKAEDLGLDTFDNTNKEHATLIWNAFKEYYAQQFNTHDILVALLHDCPYELYWFDKVTGMEIRPSIAYKSINGICLETQIVKLEFSFKVAADYMSGDNTTVTSEVADVKTAVANANAIAEKYADKTDYEKMLGFKNEICALTDYNHYASKEENNVSYGNPWQMIYVFDGNAATKVVCEGYAKAFQYLCDMTGVECYTTKGDMDGGTGAGAHMWNIVPMGNSNYLVDITNSDAGTIGQEGQLFLAGTAGDVENGYVFDIDGLDITYTYDAKEIAMWGSELLTLASEKFNPVPKELAAGTYRENISWTVQDTDYDGNGDKIVISGDGEIADITEATPWDSYKTDITEVVLQEGITSIGMDMFRGYTSLKSVELPQTLTKIGSYAFSGSAIAEIIIPEGVTAIESNTFDGCTSLKNVVIPATVKTIGFQAFANCTALTTLEIPEGVTTIDKEAFANCTDLKEIALPATLTSAQADILYNCKNLKTIIFNGSAQNWYDNLVDVVLSEDANVEFKGEKIAYVLNSDGTGYVLIYWSDASGDITVAESYNGLPVTEIGEAVFAHNSNITSVVVPKDVTVIGTNAFNSCKEIKTITLPAAITDIGNNALAGCEKLETIVYDGDAQDWYDRDLDSCIPDDVYVDFTGDSIVFVKVYNTQDGELDEYKLYAWSKASGDIVIPATYHDLPVTQIYFDVFAFNENVTSVEIPEGIEAIQAEAFKNCTNLKSVKIPESLRGIGKNVFAGCENLETVYYPSSYNWNHNDITIYSGNENLLEAQVVAETDWGYEYIGEEFCLTGKENITEELIIPAIINGHTVDIIYSSDSEPVFADCTQIKTVFIANGIQGLQIDAFNGCTGIEEIIVPESLKSYYNGSGSHFEGVPKDAEIYVAEENNYAKAAFKQFGFTNILDYHPIEDISVVETLTLTLGAEPAAMPAVSKVPSKAYGKIALEWKVAEGCEDIVEIVTDDAGNQQMKAKSLGNAKIVVTDIINGFSKEIDVTVKLPKGTKIKIGINEEIEEQGLETGENRELTVTYELDGETYTIASDKVTFKSMEGKSTSKNVLVDENGVVTSLYTGTKSATAKITATLKSDSSKTASITVKAIAKQIQELPLDRPAARYTDETGTEQEILAEATEYGYILAIPKEVVKNGDIAVELSGQFAEEVKEEFAAAEAKLPEIKWTTSDSKAAKISAAKSEEVAEGEDYKAIVTIKKGSTGIYTVSATANDINKASIAVDIDVRDYTPRLEKNSVTLNTFNETGAEIKLYTAYDAALENYDPETAMLIAEEDEEINVRLADENGNFYATYDAENKTVTIRSNKIVQKGVTGYNSKNTYKFDLLINTSKGITKQAVTIKVANKMPSVTVKQSGTFNSFYKDSEVFTAVTAKGAVVKGVTLVEGSTPTFITEYVPEAAATEETAAQKSGIKVRWADKTDPTTKYVKNKDKKMVADTSAELMVELEGYRKAVKVKYTVGIKETKPGLVQSRSSSKYTYLNRENEAITVTNKATGELIDFNSAEWSVVSNSGEYVTVTAEGEELKLTVNEENKFTSKKPTHSVKISVQEDKWVKPVEITHKVTVNLAKPTVSPKETTVSLRTWYADNVEMQFKASETNSPVPVFSFNSSSSDVNVQTEAAKIEFVQDGWKVTAKVKDGENVAKGSYSYTVTPEITLADGSTEALKAVKVTVKVDSEVPALSLDKKAVTLSGTGTDKDVFTAKANDTECPAPVRYEITADTKDKKVKAEAEKVLFTYDGWEITAGLDINNLPKNASYKYKATAYVQSADGSETALKTTGFTVKVSTPSVKASLSKTSVSLNRDILEAYEIVPSVTEGYEIVDVTVTPNTKAGEKIKVEYDRENNIITAKITDSTISKNSDKAYNYPVTVTAEIDKDGVTVQKELKLTLGIKVVSGARKLSTKASGSIDLAVREKGITYTITGVKNYNYELGDIETIRLEGDYKGTDINELFEIETVETAENEPVKVMVKAKADAEVKSGTEYKYKIIVDVKDAGEAASSTLKVKTKQTGLKLKVSGDLTVYHKHESGSITIKVTGPAGAKIAENGIVVNTAKSSSSLIKAVEFKAAVDNGDGTWTIDYEVVRMSLLKNGKSYKVVFEATPEGNGTDKAPQTLTATIKVKR